MDDGHTGGEAGIRDAATSEARRWIRRADMFTVPEDLGVTRTVIDETPVFFATDDKDDRIQRKHRKGRFYEPDELASIAASFPKGGVFCDIGANIGNHTIFALLYMQASRSVVFEPNPRAYRLLIVNMILNGLIERTDLRFLGYGLGSGVAEGFSIHERERNLGAATLRPDGGDVPVLPGDKALVDIDPDLLKIDVEGMEIDVLAGLESTIERCRPEILIEVSRQNEEAFAAWCDAHRYSVAEEIRAFPKNRNLLLRPLSEE